MVPPPVFRGRMDRTHATREGEAPAEPIIESAIGSAGASPSPVEEPPPAQPESPFAVRDRDPTVVNRHGEAVPLRRRTPDEQQRYRRRMNLLFALAGLVLLVLVVAVLLHVRP